jgi:hypothetical protein
VINRLPPIHPRSTLPCLLNHYINTCPFSQGNQISALVPTDVLTAYIDILHEGLICTLAHYLIMPRQPILNMVKRSLMILFRQTTIVHPLHISGEDFPLWAYKLTAFDALPPPNDTPTYFVGNACFVIRFSTYK